MLRLLLFLLCLPSGAILLMKIYGIMEMDRSAIFILVPSLIIFVLLWIWLFQKKHVLAKQVAVGFLGGLIGTLGYDIVRVPLLLMGNSVFAPITMYGVWLTDASMSDSFTDLLGWSYHFSNGITFGIMYALVMKNQRIIWAILYALLLETIFVLSPYGNLFGIAQKPLALTFAYLGHLAYGYPLGYYLRHFDSTVTTLKYFRKPIAGFFAGCLVISALLLYFTLSDRPEPTNSFTVFDEKISPRIIRIDKGGTVCFRNGTEKQQILFLPRLSKRIALANYEECEMNFTNTGIFHMLIENNHKPNPAFIICEPVQTFK